jgi:hypothetical protein
LGIRTLQALRLPRASAVQGVAIHNAQFMHRTFPVEPGKTRPTESANTDWIANYDIVSEARQRLQKHAG